VLYSDIVEKIIPFFENYPIQGEKLKDFEDFKFFIIVSLIFFVM